MRLLLILLLWFAGPAAAFAGDVAVTVRDPHGAPVADAVVSVDAKASGPIHFPWPYVMAQKDIQFHPFVLVVPVGADVSFPNFDNVRHHVYSFSPAKTFELKLYGHDETRVVHFDKPGIVQLGCNIHDSMIAFIVVVETPYAVKTDDQGVAVLHGVPTGAQTVKVWRAFMKGPANAQSLPVQVPREGVARLAVTADVRSPPMMHQMY
jgi:plastocyanin